MDSKTNSSSQNIRHRAICAMIRHGFIKIEPVIFKMNDKELMRYKGIGNKTIKEIRELIEYLR